MDSNFFQSDMYVPLPYSRFLERERPGHCHPVNNIFLMNLCLVNRKAKSFTMEQEVDVSTKYVIRSKKG